MANLSDIGHSQKRISAIDGLRAVAVLSVIIFHIYGPALPGGFIGVDVFFVISGYVVCGSLLRDPCDRFFPYITAFYVRRIVRIYPALIVELLVTGTLATLFIPSSWLVHDCSRIGLAAFFGLSNIGMILFGDSYFAPTGEYNIFTHTWSLGVEEQFYVLFPLILFFVVSASGKARKMRAILLPSLLAMSFAFSIWQTTAHRDHAYYLLPSRFWELAVGTLLCLAHHKQRWLPRPGRQSAALVIGGLAMIAVSAVFAAPKYFPFPWSIAPVLGSACCIAGVVVPGGNDFGTKLLRSPLAAYIGRISYSAYLWHWPVIVLLRWTIGLESLFSIALASLLIPVLSVASYHCVEVPMQRRAAFFRKHGLRVVVGGATVMVACSALFVLIVKSQPVIGLSVVSAHPEIWDIPKLANDSLNVGERGKTWSGKHLFVIGDSHSGAYAGMLSRLRSEEGVSVYLGSSGGSYLGSLMHPMTIPDRARAEQVLGDIRKYAKPGDVVLLACLRVLRVSEEWEIPDLQKIIEARDSPKTEAARVTAVSEGKKLIGELTKMGLVVLIDTPKPVFMAPPFRCSDWFNRCNPIGRMGFTMDRSFLLQHRSSAMRSIREVCEAFPAINVWDPFAILCPGKSCSAFDGANPLFFDGDHLTGYGNQKLYPSFVDTLGKIWEKNISGAKLTTIGRPVTTP